MAFTMEFYPFISDGVLRVWIIGLFSLREILFHFLIGKEKSHNNREVYGQASEPT